MGLFRILFGQCYISNMICVLLQNGGRLQNFMCRMFKIQDGREALNWLCNNDIPDLIIADLQMPNIDGYKFINILKNSGFYHTIPIITLSGNNSSNDRIKCFELGVDDFVMKPFNPAELKIRVRNILNRVVANY